MGPNGRDLQGGRLLGVPQQVNITSASITPGIDVELVDELAGVKLADPCLRIIDPWAGTALLCPISPDGARHIIGKLTPLALSDQTGGQTDGERPMHD